MPKRTDLQCRQRIAGAVNVVRLLFLLLVALLIGSCGSEDGLSGSGGILQIYINSPTASATYTLGSATSSIYIGGYVSESPYGKVQETACNCVGFGCLFGDPQCSTMYYPRVDIFVQNTATGQTIAATLSYSTSSPDESGYSWSATVSLISGNNLIVAQASDGRGYQGSDSITIQNP